MKVKLFAWWTNTPSITERFKRQFIGSYFNDERVTLTCEEDYDIAVVFGYTKENIKTDKDHTIFFFQEPHWSLNWDREAYKKSNRVYCPSKELYGNYDEFISHTAYMFYGGHGDEYFELDNIINYSKLEKNKNTSCIVTYRSTSPLCGTNNNNIYDKRVSLAEYLLDHNYDVDVYGQLWEYSNRTNANLKRHIYTKFIGLDDYRYSIGIENSQEHNYITEKLYDIIFFNTIPIYAGAPNINDIPIIRDIVVTLPNLDNKEECANIISTLTEDFYNKNSFKFKEIKQKLFESSDYNIWQKILKDIL
jgi:hypothetical protein